MIERVKPLKPLSPLQFAVAVLTGLNMPYADIARELKISRRAVICHTRDAAKRLPGDLPAKARVATWVRGASLGVLTGDALYGEVSRQSAAMRREFPMLALDVG